MKNQFTSSAYLGACLLCDNSSLRLCAGVRVCLTQGKLSQTLAGIQQSFNQLF
ncbi:hypothetical protein QWZ08_07895 [Ferruginibacter paludis]|uniref:hypothetical protein n=1 Tax=Ferruginibacter paludis TaxID=1310417 RepID=UPI0025B58869|nr:hypothetical protein [Ferruginibacter paludis]MDN3655543.1 hypothetical protein [Ferruginibacter paludis]